LDYIEEAFAPANDAISWAYEVTRAFYESAELFFKDGNVVLRASYNPVLGENFLKVKIKQKLPYNLRMRATDALTNLRHSFDQSLFAALKLLDPALKKTVYFPWARSPTDLNHLLKSRAIDERLWKAIRDVEPYSRGADFDGGDDLIRALAQLANGKHTVGLDVSTKLDCRPNFTAYPLEELIIPKFSQSVGLKGIILMRWKGIVEFDPQTGVSLEVVFQDKSVAGGQNVIKSLTMFHEKAKDTSERLMAACKEALS
jgi:hypothetical protein